MSVGERKPALPGEVGAKEIRGIGAVGFQLQPFGFRAVFHPTKVIEQYVALGARGNLVEALESEILAAWRVEELADPGAVERFLAAIPVACDGPDSLFARVARLFRGRVGG